MLIRIFLVSLFILFSMIGCSNALSPSSKTKTIKKEFVEDLVKLPQNSSAYLQEYNSSKKLASIDSYEQNYFRVWIKKDLNISKNNANWIFNSFTPKNSYGENLKKLDKLWFEKLQLNLNFKKFELPKRYGVTIKHVNLRALPSDKVLFLDPLKAGEGFPFDYLQNSSVVPNTPLCIFYHSKDKKWVFVKTSFSYGWLKTQDVVFLPKKYILKILDAKKVIVFKDHYKLYTKNGEFLFSTEIGEMFPIISSNAKSYTILVITKYKNSKPYYNQIVIPKTVAMDDVLEFNRENIAMILDQIANTKYGWGGAYYDRDCSSSMRDFFAPFGVWLPRNSANQAKIGSLLNVKALKDKEKLQKIKEVAIPFETLLYRKGHIGLYVGTYDNNIVVFQNMWGIKTKHKGKEGRFIVGRGVFTTLEAGKNLKDYDANSSFSHKLKSINIITH